MVVGLLLMSMTLALSVPAYAGRGGFGGGGMGMSGGGFGGGGVRGGSFGSGSAFQGGMGMSGSGFRGGRGAFATGGFHRGRSFHGHKFHRCCVNGVFFTGFAFGGGFGAPFYYYPYPDDWPPPYPYMPYPYAPYVPDIDVSLPAVQASPMPRESCFPSGCYHLQGDGVTVAYQWVWVPAPPPPPTVIPYPTGRYELRGPSRWEWVPNNASGSTSSMLPASSKTIDLSPANLSTRGLYHWKDESGVTHWTQGLEGVPEKYRPKASSGVSSGGSTL